MQVVFPSAIIQKIGGSVASGSSRMAIILLSILSRMAVAP